ncbi:MAG: aspartate kinase [Gammaproteobacteria bacterium]|jgi:aspartate kinase|nr:aspartate kinase [Gammaproteobacteria bacterium]
MSLIVQKYGGTSMADPRCIAMVAERVKRAKEEGHDVVVVVSAMAGETDRLLSLAHALNDNPKPREYSALLATGEQASTALLCIALDKLDYQARSFTGLQAGIQTTSEHKKARIADINTKALRASLAKGEIPVVAGFQGVNTEGDVTTLGRGGSDTTAVAVAAALQADECQIYTDVDGVYTADPRIEPQARRLAKVTFEEMLELASLGAKVLQTRSVELIGKYRVPLRVLSTFSEGGGTLVTFEDDTMEQPLVSGIAYNRNEAKLTVLGVPDVPGVASQIISSVSTAGIDVDIIVQNIAYNGVTDFSFTVHRDDYQRALAILGETAERLGARVVLGDNKIGKLSLVGVGMRSHAGVANTMFATLGEEGVNIQMITTSEIKISVVIEEREIDRSVRALHKAFKLDCEPVVEMDPYREKERTL